jgi:hypothetical protein
VQFALQNFDVNPWYVVDVTFTTGNTNAATTVTPPAGWTAVTSNATTGVGLSAYTRVLVAGDPLSWSFGLSQSSRAAGTISAYSGVDTASPVDVVSVGTNPSGLSHTAPSVTTSGANRLGITVNAITAATTFTPTAGSTERADQAATATAPTAAVETADFPIAAAGAAGVKVFDLGRGWPVGDSDVGVTAGERWWDDNGRVCA